MRRRPSSRRSNILSSQIQNNDTPSNRRAHQQQHQLHSKQIPSPSPASSSAGIQKRESSTVATTTAVGVTPEIPLSSFLVLPAGSNGHTTDDGPKDDDVIVVCLKCRRAPSPDENPIVFCSKCERTWHKFCHIPAVPNEVIFREDADWFCFQCTAVLDPKTAAITSSTANPLSSPNGPHNHAARLINQKVGINQKPKPGLVGSSSSPRVTIRIKRSLPSVSQVVTVNPAQLKSCRPLTTEQKNAYFATLSRDSLVELLMHASNTSPDLALYNPDLPTLSVTPTTSSTSTPNPNPFSLSISTSTSVPSPPPPPSKSPPGANKRKKDGSASTTPHKTASGSSSRSVTATPIITLSQNHNSNHLPDPNTPALELDPQSYYPLPGAGLMRELIQTHGYRDKEWLVVDDDGGGAFNRQGPSLMCAVNIS